MSTCAGWMVLYRLIQAESRKNKSRKFVPFLLGISYVFAHMLYEPLATRLFCLLDTYRIGGCICISHSPGRIFHARYLHSWKYLAAIFPKPCHSVLAPSWLSSNRTWKTARGRVMCTVRACLVGVFIVLPLLPVHSCLGLPLAYENNPDPRYSECICTAATYIPVVYARPT